MQLPSQTHASRARLSYDTGHGDFSFGRLVDRHYDVEAPSEEDDAELVVDSDGVPVVELGNFQRWIEYLGNHYILTHRLTMNF